MGAVFATNVLLARTLSTAEFAAYVVAAAAAMFLAMPAAFGAPRVILRLVREGLATNRPRLAAESAWACLRLVLATSAVLAFAFVVGAQWLDDAHKWQAVREYSALVAAWFVISAICLSISHALQGFDDFRAAALTGAKNGGILPNAFTLGTVVIAAQAGYLTLRLALALQVIAQLFTLAYACTVLWRTMRRAAQAAATEASGSELEAPNTLWMFKESWPILIVQLTSLGIAHVDVLLVSWLSSDSEIAAYSAVARLCELLGSAQILAVAVAAPFISELYISNQLTKLEKMLRGIASLTAIPTLVAAAALLIAPRAALTYTYGPEFAIGATALRAGVVGCCIAVLSGVNSLVMIMTGQQRQLLWASVTASILYLLIAPVMIAVWSITGAAVTTSIIFGAYNITITLMIKSRIGIWTTASLAPSAYAFAYRRAVGGYVSSGDGGTA
ncbi:MAG TPA: oligosaccharide flippase family protein [Lacipirellula sp.]